MKKNIINYLLLGVVVSPLFASAEPGVTGGGVLSLIDKAENILGDILPLVMTLAIFYFLWSLANYMLKAGEEQATARQQMLWGIIILFVMVSFWGLVNILSKTIF